MCREIIVILLLMEILDAFINMLNEMSPYILLGLFIAGLLHAFVPARIMSRHLSGSGWRSVVKAAMIGVPLPLCSCGVLPTAVAMRRNGASRAASASFLISTPQTGVDSIAATYSLLGPAFAVVRPVAALVTAAVGGCLVGVSETRSADNAGTSCPVTDGGAVAEAHTPSFAARMKEALYYGFVQMVQSIGKWLVLGLVIAALITVLVPADFFVSLGDRPLLAMLAVVAIAVPMYVCATGSIPIALSLMMKGLSPGTALVLLMAGPAANFASIAIISRTMGRRSAAVYISSIVIGAMAFGLAIDYLLPREWFVAPLVAMPAGACHAGASWFDILCSVVLVALLVGAFAAKWYNHKHLKIESMNKEYKINGMSCPHCKATVEKNLALVPGVTSVTVDLPAGIAYVEGEHDPVAVIEKIKSIGFDPVE